MNNVEQANALTNQAANLLGNGDPQELPVATLELAGQFLEDAFKLLPNHPRSLYNVGNIRDELSLARGGPFVSMELYDRSLAIRVTPEALLNKGRILDIQENQHADALELYERAVIQQGLYRGAYGMGTCMLMLACRTGDPDMWRLGWYWYEHRKGKAEMKGHPAMWRGENLESKRLLIYTDFGLGDQVWAMRWLKLAKAQGANTVIVCGPEMLRLYGQQDYVDEVHAQGNAKTIECDYLTPIMSMGTHMDPTSEYKAVDPYVELKVADYEDQAFPRGKTKRVGVAWQGSVTRGYPSWRNVEFELLLKHLPKIETVEYVSLQKGVDMPWGSWPIDVESIRKCRDLLDTARLIRSCDLVVTVGSVLSMLAPALGVPTWVLNTHNSAWQFGPNDAPVHWFRSIISRFCQRKQGDWVPPLWNLAQELREWSCREP